MPQPQPPDPLVRVPIGVLERAAAVPEPAQGLAEVAAAVCVAELAVRRPRRRREAGLPRGDVLCSRDEESFLFVVALQAVLAVAGVGVEGVEPGNEFFGTEVR